MSEETGNEVKIDSPDEVNIQQGSPDSPSESTESQPNEGTGESDGSGDDGDQNEE